MIAPAGKGGGGSSLAQAFLNNKASAPSGGSGMTLPEIQRPTRPAFNFGSMAPRQQAPAPVAPTDYASMGFRTLRDPREGFTGIVSPTTGQGHTVKTGMSHGDLGRELAALDEQYRQRTQWQGGK